MAGKALATLVMEAQQVLIPVAVAVGVAGPDMVVMAVQVL
jgi:hypothetical protein